MLRSGAESAWCRMPRSSQSWSASTSIRTETSSTKYLRKHFDTGIFVSNDGLHAEKDIFNKSNGDLKILTYAKSNNITQILISELSRLGRNAFEVLSTVKEMIDAGINIYFQKEQFTLLDEEGKPSLFAPVMIATLSTCAQLERENIKFRLNSGRANYIAKGGRLGRKKGSTKSDEAFREQYKDVITLLRKGYSVRNIAKLQGVGISTVQRIKNQFINNK